MWRSPFSISFSAPVDDLDEIGVVAIASCVGMVDKMGVLAEVEDCMVGVCANDGCKGGE